YYEPDELAVPRADVEYLTDAAADRLLERDGLRDIRHGGRDELRELLIERGEDGFLRREVEVDRAEGDVGRFGDVGDRRPAEAALGEDAPGGREDFLAAGRFRKLGPLAAVEDGRCGQRDSTECGSFCGSG